MAEEVVEVYYVARELQPGVAAGSRSRGVLSCSWRYGKGRAEQVPRDQMFEATRDCPRRLPVDKIEHLSPKVKSRGRPALVTTILFKSCEMFMMTTEQQLGSFHLHVQVWLKPKLRFAGLEMAGGAQSDGAKTLNPPLLTRGIYS